MKLAYDRAGTGPALVLLHPLGADRQVWRPVLEYLTPVRDCIAVDLPGFGDSEPIPRGEPADPAALARAIAGFLQAEGIERPHVAGNSLGGWVALELALAGHAASVTAIAPAGLWRNPLPPKPEVARRLSRLAGPALPAVLHSAAGRRAVLLGTMTHPERMPPDDALALVRAYARAPGFTAVNRAMRAGTFTRLADIEVPVAIVWPQYDRVVTRVNDLPPGVEVRELPGCGHIPMWDDPRGVAEALIAGSGAQPALGPGTAHPRSGGEARGENRGL
jgi:pimeloyl-ACP methyl ester carboxylesterase